MKACSVCKETKDLDQFYLVKTRKGDRQPMARCKKCHAKAVAKSAKGTEAKRKSDAKYKAKVRQKTRLRRHGLDKLTFAVMEASQQGCCAICWKFVGEGTHIDHNHATGAVRALLCPQCNVGLGSFRDDPILLIRAAIYLEATKHYA